MTHEQTNDTYDGLTRYLVRSENGEREWHAEDAVHAREQHDDALGRNGRDRDRGHARAPRQLEQVAAALLGYSRAPAHHKPMKGAAMNSTTITTEQEQTRDAAEAATAKARESQLRLLVAFKPLQSRNDTIELTAEPMMVSTDADGREQVRNLLPDGFDGHPLADLQIRSLADHDPSAGLTYPNCVEYRECYAVDLKRAIEIQKTLKRLDRALSRVEGELGPPESFTAYLARCAVALRICTFGFRVGDSSGWHDRNAYEWTDPAGMVFRIHDHLSRWRSQPPR